MKISIRGFLDSLSGFTTKHEKFIFTTLARILAIGCMLVAAFFAWKLAGQINM
jgi:hypothetical protein